MNRNGETPRAGAWVLGCGSSGAAAARLLARVGETVTVLDAAPEEAVVERARELRERGISVIAGVQSLPRGGVTEAIVSPGVPADHSWCAALRQRGVPLVSELELGWRHRRAPVIAVTGSNGKSTAVTMMAHALRSVGFTVAAGGNLGEPMCDLISRAVDYLVVEVSSFQLETVDAFRPDVGVLLNLQPNHLDRHGTMERYGELKARLFRHTGPEDLCLVDESALAAIGAGRFGGGRLRSLGRSPGAAVGYADGRVWFDGEPVADLAGSCWANSLHGPVAAAVAAVMERLGAPVAGLAGALASFEPLPHRLERLGEIAGVSFIDDSKATSLAAMGAALEVMDGPVRLIAGGRLKEGKLEGLADAIAKSVVGLYAIGEAAPAMVSAWSNRAACMDAGSLESAFRHAVDDARAGETVLLSPGGTSFDQFRSFVARGRAFQALVRELREEQQPGTAPDPTRKAMDNGGPSVTIANRNIG